MARRTRDDWLVLGLARLAEAGPRAIRLEPICAAAGATRGSFYHHFRDHDAFVAALLDYWRELADPEVLDYLEELSDTPPLTALAQLLDPAVETAIRRLGAVDEAARAALADIDEARIAWLAARYDDRPRAETAYAAYIGLQHLFDEPGDSRVAMIDTLLSVDA